MGLWTSVFRTPASAPHVVQGGHPIHTFSLISEPLELGRRAPEYQTKGASRHARQAKGVPPRPGQVASHCKRFRAGQSKLPTSLKTLMVRSGGCGGCGHARHSTASTEFKQKERGEANPKQGKASRPPQGRRRPGRCTSLPHSSKDRRWKRLSASQGDICHGLGDTDEEKEAQSEPRGGKRGGTHAWTHARHGQLEEGGGRRARGYILGSAPTVLERGGHGQELLRQGGAGPGIHTSLMGTHQHPHMPPHRPGPPTKGISNASGPHRSNVG